MRSNRAMTDDRSGGCLCGAVRYRLEQRLEGHAFAGERHRVTEADVLKMAGVNPGEAEQP